MSKTENQEIGELISEITGKGYSEIETKGNDAEPVRTVEVLARNPKTFPTRGHRVFADSLVGALAIIVDCIRAERGEPTLAEEVSKMLEAEAEHSKAVIWTGPGSKCECGCAEIMFERTVKMSVSWITGEVFSIGATRPPEPGEIGRCPDCGKWYRLGS